MTQAATYVVLRLPKQGSLKTVCDQINGPNSDEGHFDLTTVIEGHIVWSTSLCADFPCCQSNRLVHTFWSYSSALNEKCFNQLSLSRGSQGRQFMLDCTLKAVTVATLREYEQRVIIKFLFDEGADACQIAERLRAQFHGDAYTLHTVQFWITEL
jgi:hypothetical protein